MGRRPEQTSFQRRHPDGQQVHKKMLNITDHQGKANQSYNEILHYYQNGKNQQHKKQQVLVRRQRKGNSLAMLVGIQIGADTVENKGSLIS